MHGIAIRTRVCHYFTKQDRVSFGTLLGASDFGFFFSVCSGVIVAVYGHAPSTYANGEIKCKRALSGTKRADWNLSRRVSWGEE
eukprot:3884065-Rhodomonas_salina.1